MPSNQMYSPRRSPALYPLLFSCVLSSPLFLKASGTPPSPAAWWPLDTQKNQAVLDRSGRIEDQVEGTSSFVRGVKSSALQLDGYTTCIVRKADKAPQLKGEFTCEAWVALGAYPWNFCPVIAQHNKEEKGFFFGIGPRGEVCFNLKAKGGWITCTTNRDAVTLRRWHHIAGTFSEKQNEVRIFVDGKPAAQATAAGAFEPASETDLRIGADNTKVKPSNIHREFGTLPWWFSIDGILDEIKIRHTALSPEQIENCVRKNSPETAPPLPERRLPSGPEGPGRFGAYYCNLKYYPQWDALWSVGPDPDVVVRFDRSAVRVVFWRGSRYSAAWVSGNDLWMADQSVEAWNKQEGCYEHMQDRACRYSHVRIIETSDARAVIHWRYAPVCSHNKLWNVDRKTGRACWVDEYYYIYPDQLGIRKVCWNTGKLGGPRQFQESLPFTHPGQLQSDVVHAHFATVGNLKGETADLKFVKNPGKKKENLPADLIIQQYNFKSPDKPSIIFEPGSEMHYVKDFDIRRWKRPGSCNHWPVGQAYCDGRTSQAADRPTHFLGFPISYPPVHEKDGRSWWNGLYGMTGKTVRELAVVAKSWIHAPELTVGGEGFEGRGYDRSERIYTMRRTEGNAAALRFELAGSAETPVFNPAFLVENWGEATPELFIDGKKRPVGEKVRFGFVRRLEGTHLVVWIDLTSEENATFTLQPEK